MIDLKSFDLNLLLVLDVLFEERSITKTAQRLGVSQPMVSISLKKLRQNLGDELFVHSGSEMVPTERALAFEEPLRNIIQDIRHRILEEAGFDPEREGGVQNLPIRYRRARIRPQSYPQGTARSAGNGYSIRCARTARIGTQT